MEISKATLTVHPLNKMVSIITFFNSTQKQQLEYILLSWLSNIDVAVGSNLSYQGAYRFVCLSVMSVWKISPSCDDELSLFCDLVFVL